MAVRIAVLRSWAMRRSAVVTGLLVLGLARAAAAIPYETFIDIEDEADLQDLLAALEISQDTYDELIELLENGVDLTTADRAQLYALPNLTYDDVDRILAFRATLDGVIRDPAALVSAGVLSEDKLLAIAAFLRLGGEPGQPLDLHGRVTLRTRWTVDDGRAPPIALQGRFTALEHLTVGGAGVLSRLEIGVPVYDPDRAALIAAPRSNRVRLPKLFAKWEDDQLSAVAGTFRAGFGQRLVFDNTIHSTANGLYADDQLSSSDALTGECNESAGELPVSPCSGAAGARHVTPDWGYRVGLLGAGLGARRVALGDGWLQAYAWASAQRRSIYQYELFVPSAACPDPHDDDDPACAAPDVFVRPRGDRLTPTTRYAFETLPDMFLEKVVGGNVAYFADGRSSVGATAYGASVSDLVNGIELDTQEWSRQLTGRRFGAAGINASLGRGAYDGFAEVAYSYDRLPASGAVTGGGGPAAIVRITRTAKREELELVARYYATDFANPFARPISQPDELDGQRARDELGARLRHHRAGNPLALRTSLDVWVPPSTLRAGARAAPRLDGQVRADLTVSGALRVGASLRYQDKDFRIGGHDKCFEVTSETLPTGAPVPCAGRQLTTIGRAEVELPGRLTVGALLEHQLLDDDGLDPEPFRQDLAAWLVALWRPIDDVRLRARVRYRDLAIASPSDLETSLSGVLDASVALRRRDLLRLRVETVHWRDDRASTALRAPNPELRLWLSYEARL
jgi:hypothetical protein